MVNNTREIYEIRNYIISVFEATEKSVNWLRYSEYFKIIKKKLLKSWLKTASLIIKKESA